MEIEYQLVKFGKIEDGLVKLKLVFNFSKLAPR